MKEPLLVGLREGWGAMLQMRKCSTFRAVISVNSCLKHASKWLLGKTKKGGYNSG